MFSVGLVYCTVYVVCMTDMFLQCVFCITSIFYGVCSLYDWCIVQCVLSLGIVFNAQCMFSVCLVYFAVHAACKNCAGCIFLFFCCITNTATFCCLALLMTWHFICSNFRNIQLR